MKNDIADVGLVIITIPWVIGLVCLAMDKLGN
jgi:hypothetical protein